MAGTLAAAPAVAEVCCTLPAAASIPRLSTPFEICAGDGEIQFEIQSVVFVLICAQNMYYS